MKDLPTVTSWSLLLVALTASLTALLWWTYTIDDAYITARCAENLVATGTPSFNPGDSLEVASSPASVWILSGAIALGLEPVLTAKALGLLAAVITCLLVLRSVHRSTRSTPVAVGAALALATAPGWTIHATGGLETTVFGLAVLGACHLPDRRSGLLRALAWILSTGAASALRPEGLAVSIVAIVWAWARRTRREALVATAVTAALIAVRLDVHGALLPLAFDAKPTILRNLLTSDLSWTDSIRQFSSSSLAKIRSAPLGMGWLLVVPFLGAVVDGARRRRTTIFHAVGLLGLGLYAVSPPDWMPAQRYLVPYLPVLLVSVAAWLHESTGVTHWTIGRGRLPAAAAYALALLLLNVGAQASWSTKYRDHRVIAALDASRFHAPIGRWLAEHAGPEDRLLAYEIGAVGYLGGVHVIDHEGIAHQEIAQIIAKAGSYERVRSGADAARAERVAELALRERPDWALIRSRVPFEAEVGLPLPPPVARTPLERMLLRRMGPRFRIAAVFPMTRPHDRYFLLKRAD